jgi:sulfatase maturation enzyme AslB (radical SAM superfamily)
MKTCLLDTDIKWLHVEASSRCNAWCPACPRNNNGFGIINGLIEQDLDSNRFTEVLSTLPNLHAIQFCGNYGDPIIAKNILELIAIAVQHVKKIQIHTNGSLRSTTWWAELAILLKDIDHDIWFGLDGIEEVHEIYRQGTDYNKIINNAQAFINAGGSATWQFIPYAHNEHQIRNCIRTSQALGFKKFKLVKSFRNIIEAKHYRTGATFNLSPPNSVGQIVKIKNLKSKVLPENCMHLEQPGIYLGADGKLNYCCYHHTLNSNKKEFDTLNEILYNDVDLTHITCMTSCGI